MAKSRIAIIGTGLIGTSIGLNLAARKERTYEIVGADRDRTNLRTAKKMGAIDREVGSLEEAASGSRIIIIAVPVMGARNLLQELGKLVEPGTVITDVCSTKADVLRWAAEFLPENVHFVGGHPMAGRETSGPSGASLDLFQHATWAITPSPRADEDAVSVVLGMVEAMDAVPLYIDPAEHDQYAAAVSHLPLLTSVALFRMVRDSQGWEDASLIAGPGFRDITRLASTDATMSRDIMVTNRDAVVHWLDRLQTELSNIRTALTSDSETLLDLFKSTQMDRDIFITDPPVRRRPEGPAAPSAQDSIGRMFVGGLYDKLKDAQNRVQPRADNEGLRRKLGVPDDRDR